MNLIRVTITGADKSVKPSDLIQISKEYPFVEWGVLLSKSSEGSRRFPTLKSIARDQAELKLREMATSGNEIVTMGEVLDLVFKAGMKTNDPRW